MGADYQQERRRILHTGAICVYCGDPATSADHIVPAKKGGQAIGNLAPACGACNSRIRDGEKPPQRFPMKDLVALATKSPSQPPTKYRIG